MKKNSLFVCLSVCLFVSGQRSEVKKTSKADFHKKRFYGVLEGGQLETGVHSSVDPLGGGPVTPLPLWGQINMKIRFFTRNVSLGF
jgi:hypothetical protein